MSPPPVTLRAMRQDEYEVYSAARIAEYADALSGSLPRHEAEQKARQDKARFLPHGLATESHRLLVAENEAGEPVGRVWVGLQEPRTGSREVAWLFDIRVSSGHRRRGYGAAILAAVETIVRDAGAARLALNVFGDNHAAIALYEAAGYQVSTQQMVKSLG